MGLFSEPLPKANEEPPESLVEYVARQNGPLDHYHPQMLLQCLIWGRFPLSSLYQLLHGVLDKIELVKEIITNLARVLLDDDVDSKSKELPHLPVERFLQSEQPQQGVSREDWKLREELIVIFPHSMHQSRNMDHCSMAPMPCQKSKYPNLYELPGY